MKKLNKKYTKAELSDSFVFRNVASPEEKKKAADQLAEARKQLKSKAAGTSGLHAWVLQLRYQMEDYIRWGYYDRTMTFSYFLQKYIDLSYKTNKEFANDINMDVTELSQILNHHRGPSEKIIVRLEIHSNNAIPAVCWYRLLEKERAHELQTDMVLREAQAKYVKRKLNLDNN